MTTAASPPGNGADDGPHPADDSHATRASPPGGEPEPDDGSDAREGSGPAEAPGATEDLEATDVHGTEDATLGGYFRVHERPPAFEGSDGQPYTVSIEVEKTPDLTRPFIGYLVFPRWAETGVGIVGHVETPILWRGTSRDDVLARAGDTPLLRVKEMLDEAIGRKVGDGPDGAAGSSPGQEGLGEG